MDQIVDLNNLLRGIHETHCCALVERAQNCNYDYRYRMLMAYVSSTVSIEAALNATAMHNIDGKMLLKTAIA